MFLAFYLGGYCCPRGCGEKRCSYPMKTWFEELIGFPEEDYATTQAKLVVDEGRLISSVTGRSYRIGMLQTPSLAEVRSEGAAAFVDLQGTLQVSVVQADVRNLLGHVANSGATFQVASQFNLLEMTGPAVTPEMGVTQYAFDRTQGPVCAIAAGAATIYRNYFVPLDGQEGQTASRQIDCLSDLGHALGNAHNSSGRCRTATRCAPGRARRRSPGFSLRHRRKKLTGYVANSCRCSY